MIQYLIFPIQIWYWCQNDPWYNTMYIMHKIEYIVKPSSSITAVDDFSTSEYFTHHITKCLPCIIQYRCLWVAWSITRFVTDANYNITKWRQNDLGLAFFILWLVRYHTMNWRNFLHKTDYIFGWRITQNTLIMWMIIIVKSEFM